MKLAELSGRAIVLLGVGEETLCVLPHLRAVNVASVLVVEPDPISQAQRERLEASCVTSDDIVAKVPDTADVVLRSPGFPRHRPDVALLITMASMATTPTGLWLATRGGHDTIVVTGTKGKSTTATLIRDGLVDCGIEATLAGNIGTPVWKLDPHLDGIAVVELSSYHGADLIASGEIAVLTLLTADHLDWHGSPQQYRRDKLKVLTTPQADGTPVTHRIVLADAAIPAYVKGPLERVGGDTTNHMERNAALAAAAINDALALHGLDTKPVTELVTQLLAAYPALPGRLAHVASVNGVDYIDDALASNPTATAAGLESLRGGRVVLVCGGHDRNVSLEPVAAELADWPTGSVSIVWLGEDDDHRRIELFALDAVDSAISVGSLGDGVILASLAATAGSTVLFSPLAPTERAEGSWVDRSATFQRVVAMLEEATS